MHNALLHRCPLCEEAGLLEGAVPPQAGHGLAEGRSDGGAGGAATVELAELAHRIWIYIIKEADLHFQVQIRTRIINLASKQIEAIKKYFRSSKLECGSIFIDQREFGISVKAHTTYCKPFMRREFLKRDVKT